MILGIFIGFVVAVLVIVAFQNLTRPESFEERLWPFFQRIEVVEDCYREMTDSGEFCPVENAREGEFNTDELHKLYDEAEAFITFYKDECTNRELKPLLEEFVVRNSLIKIAQEEPISYHKPTLTREITKILERS